MYKLFVLVMILFFTACAKRDLDIICSSAEAALDEPQPEMRGVRFAVMVDESISPFGDVRKGFEAIAHADPSNKYDFFLNMAQYAGYPEWKCPALERLFQPQ